MKQIKNFFRIFLVLLLLPFSQPGNCSSILDDERLDSIEIGLVTCSPHDEIYSLYGHSAIRFHDLCSGEDICFNYGVFNYSQSFFVLRFVFGKTDYELGIAPFRGFCKYYKDWGCEVSELLLDLTNEEKRNIIMALMKNWAPENRVYRYNFFFDNCATRPRDIVEANISGRVAYEERTNYAPSFREMIHSYTSNHPWAAFGNDLLLGARADLVATQRQQHFIPANLSYDFQRAKVVSSTGVSRPLVAEKRIIVPASGQSSVDSWIPTPLLCAGCLLFVLVVIAWLEWRRGLTFRWVDATLMLMTGLSGIVILVMFFSEHPTTSTNLQILLLNPLPLFFLRKVMKRHPVERYWKVQCLLIALFFICNFWQCYAEGMNILALCLLTRILIHLRYD